MDAEKFKRFFEALDSPDINENIRDYFKILTIYQGQKKKRNVYALGRCKI